MTIEDILDETGGFGRFQFFIVLCTCMNRLALGWSMLQMTFAGFVPEWFCTSPNVSHSVNTSSKACFFNISGSSSEGSDGEVCDTYKFENSPRTITNEWNLVCDLSWVNAAVISIQMAGVLLGVVLARLLRDCIGAKKTMYLFVLEHAALNLVAAFSVNWPMFAVCRFFIGIGIGAILETSVPYPLEFLPIKWRPLVSALPIWPLGIAALALVSWLMRDWSHLHIACAVLSFPGVFGYFFVPESLRWLTAHKQMSAAQDIVTKIAVVNQKLQPRKASIMVQTVAWNEQKVRESNKKYTHLDILRGWKTAVITVTMCYHWFSLSVVYYGISFSVSRFAGNLYINIFLLSVVELPVMFLTLFSDNRLGRKWTSVICLAAACLPALACVVVQYEGHANSRLAVITGLLLATKLGSGAAWAVIEIWGSELYPTMMRSVGCGAANISGRVGAVVAPFLIDLDSMASISFIVIGCLLVVDVILCFLIQDTSNSELAATSASVSAGGASHSNGTRLEDGSSGDDDKDNRCSPKFRVHVLETTIEESYTDELEQNTINTQQESDVAAGDGDVPISLEMIEKISNISQPGSAFSNISKEKSGKNEKSESKPRKFPKKKLPKEIKESKPKMKTSDKVMNDDNTNKKSKTKSDNDCPPYIESQSNKRIRYSIY